jgi:predicted transcriptional regulator
MGSEDLARFARLDLILVAARLNESSLRQLGDLQAEIMAVVWKLEQATVDEVRTQQPARRRSAYTTLQTVMNRLVDRGLLKRQRRGRAFVYSAQYDESEYLALSIRERLSDASPQARRAALVSLVDGLRGEDLDELARLAARVRRARKS